MYIGDNKYIKHFPNMLADVNKKVPVVIDTVDSVLFWNEEPVSDDSDETVEWNDDADDVDEDNNDFVQL